MKRRNVRTLILTLCLSMLLPGCRRGSDEDKTGKFEAPSESTSAASEAAEKTTAAGEGESEKTEGTAARADIKTPIKRKDQAAEPSGEETAAPVESSAAPETQGEGGSSAETTADAGSQESGPAGSRPDGEIPQSDGKDKTELPVPENFEPQVLIDDEKIKVTAEGFDFTKKEGFGVKLRLENNTEQQLTADFRGVSVNYWMADPYSFVLLNPKESKTFRLDWKLYDLAENFGIQKVLYINLGADLLATDGTALGEYKNLAVYPFGKEAASSLSADEEVEGYPFFENEYGQMLLQNLYADDEKGMQLEVYFRNTGSKTVEISANDLKVNGKAIGSMWAMQIEPGMRCKSFILYNKQAMQAQGVERADELELTICLKEYEDGKLSDPLYQEIFSIAPEYE